MVNCPLCKKKVPPLGRDCPSCHADLSLLADYVGNLAVGLAQAEELTRAGLLGEAVWAYLAVLEVDPDNALARRQVGRVVTAVRQFDSASPSRRWLKKLQRRTRFRRWMASWEEGEGSAWTSLYWLLLVLGALFLGYFLGQQAQRAAAPPAESSIRSSSHAILEREGHNHDRETPSFRHAHHPGGRARPGAPQLPGGDLDRAAAAAV